MRLGPFLSVRSTPDEEAEGRNQGDGRRKTEDGRRKTEDGRRPELFLPSERSERWGRWPGGPEGVQGVAPWDGLDLGQDLTEVMFNLFQALGVGVEFFS